MPLNRLTFLLATFYVLVFNIPLFEIVRQGIEKQQSVNYIFIASIPILLIAALSIIFSCFTFKKVVKPFFIILTLLSSLVFYAALKYSIVFDYGMIENIFETNQSEALTYVNLASISNFILTGIFPSILIYKINILYYPIKKEIIKKLLFILSMFAVIAVIAVFFLQNYLAFGRNNDLIKRYMVPTYFVGSIIKYVNKNYFETPLTYRTLGTDAAIDKHLKKPELMVLVVGETARAKNYHYYGYSRQTNPYTSKQKVIAFNDFTSCGTATAVSLPCMFSRLNRSNYDHRRAISQDDLVDVVAHAGIDVKWFDNDSGCKGVCKRVKSFVFSGHEQSKNCDGMFCRDQVLVDKLNQTLAEIKKPENTMIILHIIGSHGPTYYLRYPKDKRLFQPDCQRSDIENCSHAELINSYDNTIAYTDYIVSQVISSLKTESKRFDTSMIYLSDHGESLGENGMYLHGTPYSFAPKEQTHIPFLMWFSPNYVQSNDLNLSCVRQQALRGGFSHDNLFDTVLGILNVSTKIYRPEQDILFSCRK